MSFEEINIRAVKESAVGLISDDWALVSAGDENAWNTMTVSWGGLGEIWGKDAAFIFIRPQRYTKEFVEASDYFSLSFFGGKYKKELSVCGSKSGRDVDKAALTGFTPTFDGGSVYIEQAELVLICRKTAFFDLLPDGFIDTSVDSNYSCNDYHRMYIGEIVKTLRRV